MLGYIVLYISHLHYLSTSYYGVIVCSLLANCEASLKDVFCFSLQRGRLKSLQFTLYMARVIPCVFLALQTFAILLLSFQGKKMLIIFN